MKVKHGCAHRHLYIAILLAVIVSGCGLNLSPANAGTPTLFIITATLPPSSPPAPTWTVAPPTDTPTPTPIEGTTSTQLNVRANPTTGSTLLGIIAAFIKVQITGKDPSGNWYQIIYSQAADGKGWVTAQYVTVQNKDSIPTIGAPPAPAMTGTITGSGPSGLVLQQVNVRSGPGTNFNSLGNLNSKDVIVLTGKDPTGAWLQIQYPSGPDGKGWVTASFVQANYSDSLPIISQSGAAVGTGTSTPIPVTVTATLVPAPQDGDSAQSPAVKVVFSPSGTRSLIYSSDVSAPAGDAEDWVQFTPFGSVVASKLTCEGNGTLRVELWQGGAPIQNWGGLACGQDQQLDVLSGKPYLIQLSAVSNTGSLGYVHYTLNIESLP